jgi:hypothetical protein
VISTSLRRRGDLEPGVAVGGVEFDPQASVGERAVLAFAPAVLAGTTAGEREPLE